MNTYRYICCNRQPMLGGLPNGAVHVEYFEPYRYEDAGGHCRIACGAVEYVRELTEKEIEDYELDYESEGDDDAI